MKKYLNFVASHRKILTLLSLLLLGFFIFGASRITIDPGYDIFVPGESRYREIQEKMEANFPSSDQIIILLETDGDELTADKMGSYRRFQQFITQMEQIHSVQGPAPDRLILQGESIRFEQLIEDPRRLSQLKDSFQAMGQLSPLREHEGNLYGTFTVFPGPTFSHRNLNQIENFLEENEYTYYASGDYYVQQKVVDYIRIVLRLLPPLALLLILAVFYLQLGTVKATGLSVLPAAIGALMTVGLIGWVGGNVSILTVLAPIFTVVIGSADGLHFISHLQEASAEGRTRIQGLAETLNMVGTPMVITTLTSMIGFLALLVMDTPAFRDLALFASTGILLAGLATWYFLPLILTTSLDLKKPSVTWLNPGRFVKKLWGYPSLAIVLAILGISSIGLLRVNTEFNPLMVYKEHTDVYQSFHKVMEVNRGSLPLFALIETDQDLLHPSYGKSLIAFQDQLEEKDEIASSISIYSVFANLHSQIRGGQATEFPDNPFIVEMIKARLAEFDPDPSLNLMNRENNLARILIFPMNLKNDTLDGIEQAVASFDRKHPDLTAQVTGNQFLTRELNQMMIANQTTTLALAFILIAFLLLLSLRSVKVSLVSLFPIGITVVILYGFLGWSGISLNITTATIFSITLGVGIDYAAHYSSVWKKFADRGLSGKEAREKAYTYTFRPILANGLGLAVGFTALQFSPLQIHSYVSTLMWVSMLSGVFLSLSFLPTVLK